MIALRGLAPAKVAPPRADFNAAFFSSLLGVCAVTFARSARAGRVKSFKLGRRVVIADAELRRVQVEGF